MKKKKLIILSSLLLASVTALTVGIVISNKDKSFETKAYTWDDAFVCENWFYSGKGFMFDFTYEKGTEDGVADSIQFALMTRINGEDKMVTSIYPGGFDDDGYGNLTSRMGNLIKNEDGTYTYSMMFNEFKNQWNTGIDGTETVSKIYFRWGTLQLNKIRSSLIDSTMNVAPKADVRNEEIDDDKGLMFYSFVPSIKTGAKYGMAIVPNEYIGKLTNGYCESFTANGKSFVESYCNPHQIDSSNPYLYNRYGGGYYIKCSLNVKEQNYLRDFSAVPFEEIDGVRTYAWNICEEKQNFYSVCSRLRGTNSPVSEYVNTVLNTVQNKTANFSTTAVNAYIVDNTKQVLKTETLSNGATTLSFGAAKGETETGQLILSSTSSNLTYFAGISDLVNGSNIISHENVEIDMQHYVNIIHNWSSTSEHLSYLSDLYPDGNETCTLGWWPDALIPMQIAVRDGRNVINTTNGANQGLFIRINVPDDAASGTYTGNVIVYIPGQGTITVPVSLNVFNFSIANRKDANTIMNLSKTEIEKLYGIGYNNVCDSPQYASAYKVLADRGVSGGLVAKSWFNSNFEDYIEVVKNVVKQRKTDTYLVEFNQSNVTMRWTYRTSSSTSRTFNVDEDIFAFDDYTNSYNEHRLGLKTILRGLFDASTNELDLLKGAVFYDPHADEPGTPSAYIRNVLNFNVLRCAIDAVLADVADVTGKDSVKDSLKKVFYLMTAGPEQGISGTKNDYAFSDVVSISNVTGGANCCCSNLSDIRYKQITNFTPNMMWDWNSGIDWTKKCHKDDKGNPESSCGYSYDGLAGIYAGTDTVNTMWEYTCVQPVAPYPSLTLNTPMLRIRTNRWRQVNLNMQGFMYYMANRTQSHDDDGSESVMTEAQILDGGIYYGGASSDGLLMYPAYNTFNYADRNMYWLSSLRLENLGESNDDVNYLYLAKELIAQQANASSYEARLNNIYQSLHAVNDSPARVCNDGGVFKTARANLVSLIEELI